MGGVVFAACVSAPAFAGFEWTPSVQKSSNVPVVSPQRHVVTPGVQEAVQPALGSHGNIAPLPSLGGDPNMKIHRLHVGAGRPSALAPARKMPGIRVIEKTSALPPVAVVSSPAPVAARISHSRPAPASMPALDYHAVYSRSDNQRRKTNADAPIPLVMDNMKALSRVSRSAIVRPSVSRVNVPPALPAYQPAPLPSIPAPLSLPSLGGEDLSSPSAVHDEAMNLFGPTRPVSQGGKQVITINPYPKTGAASSRSAQVAGVDTLSPVLSNYDEAAGFGSDIPMIMALQQIVPARYTYSFAGGVNPAQRVSWQGDRPWNIVLLEMIAPLGLRADIRGNSVSIH